MVDIVNDHQVAEDRAGEPVPEPNLKAMETTTWARFRVGARHFARSQPLGMASALFIVVLALMAIFAGLITSVGPTEQLRTEILDGPSLERWFGTDDLGRDIFSRVVYGARTSLLVGTVTVFLSGAIGTVLGALSGYFGGKIDLALQRLVDAVMSIPVIILALFIVALLGGSRTNVILALAIVYTPRFSRVARGEMLRIKSSDYVTAAEALGSPPLRTIRRHGLPNLLAPVIILGSLTFGQAIVAEAALSFLGLGVPPPEPSWGRMLSDSRQLLQIGWWAVVFPGGAISITVLAFNLLGDAFRDHLDPKLVR
ncbi:MAG: ABC transporter permease [Acidimicrobiales bacterium]